MPALLHRLARANRTAVFGAAAVLVLVGLFVPGTAGAVLLLALATALVALATVTWRTTPPPARAARMVVLGALVVIALIKLTTG